MPSSVNAKVFSWSDRLFQTIFKGKPNVTSAQDINRYLNAITEYQRKLSQFLGAVRDNFNIAIDTQPSFTDVGVSEATFEFTYSIVKPLSGSPACVFYNGVRFEIPVLTAQTVEVTIPVISASYNLAYAYIVLVATKKDVTFNSVAPVLHVTDPKAFSGVTSSDYPFELPAAENVIYGAERLAVVASLDDIVLGTDEEIICIVGTLRPRYQWANASSVETTASNVVTTYILHNASMLSEIADMTKFLIPGLSSPFAPAYKKEYLNNGGIVDSLQLLHEQYVQGQSWQDYRITADKTTLDAYIASNDAAIAVLNVTLGTLSLNLTALQGTVTTLQGTVAAQGASLLLKADKAQEPWHYVGDPSEPTFGTRFENVLTGIGRTKFMRDAFGTVFVELYVNATSDAPFGAVLFSLPAGYRPMMTFPLPCSKWTGTGYPSLGFINVETSGDIKHNESADLPTGDKLQHVFSFRAAS